jgi:pimeloyl-ACP methyl ester carboxylesterase
MNHPKIGYAQVNGINMYYEIHGQGNPLVLIHGGGSTIQSNFAIILPMLAKEFMVVAVELQAHGHTSDRSAPESFEQDADDVAALVRFLDLDKASFLGFSNGGSTAMQVGIRHPGIVNKLVIVAGAYKREGLFPGFFEMMATATLESMPAHLQKAFLDINNDPAKLQNMFEKDRNRMQQFKDWPEESLASIKAPSLVIAGDRDVITTEHTVEISRKIPGASLMILPGTHGACIGEGEQKGNKIIELTIEVITGFLNQ